MIRDKSGMMTLVTANFPEPPEIQEPRQGKGGSGSVRVPWVVLAWGFITTLAAACSGTIAEFARVSGTIRAVCHVVTGNSGWTLILTVAPTLALLLLPKVRIWLGERARRLSLLGAVMVMLTITSGLALGAFVVWKSLTPGGVCAAPVVDASGTGGAVKLALTIAGAVGAAMAVTVAYRKQRDAEASHFEQALREAASQLGGDTAPKRLAGVYAVTALADAHVGINQDRVQRCVDLLCAYLRLPNLPQAHSEQISSITHVSDPYALQPAVPHTTFTVTPNDKQTRLLIELILEERLTPTGGKPASWGKCRINLYGAQLHDVNFCDAVFENLVNFNEVTFLGNANFARATFMKGGFFCGATFAARAGFSSINFNGGANFSGSKFHGQAEFSETRFGDSAAFEQVEFMGEVLFSGAVFEESVQFKECIFSECALFKGVRFKDKVWFKLCDFEGIVSYAETVFEKYTEFSDIKFKSTLNYGSVDFQHIAHFEGISSKYPMSFDEDQFNIKPRFKNICELRQNQ